MTTRGHHCGRSQGICGHAPRVQAWGARMVCGKCQRHLCGPSAGLGMRVGPTGQRWSPGSLWPRVHSGTLLVLVEPERAGGNDSFIQSHRLRHGGASRTTACAGGPGCPVTRGPGRPPGNPQASGAVDGSGLLSLGNEVLFFPTGCT